jgi:hypothetical protein
VNHTINYKKPFRKNRDYLIAQGRSPKEILGPHEQPHADAWKKDGANPKRAKIYQAREGYKV